MPKIPFYPAQTSAQTALPDTNVSPNAYGAQIGAALGQVGQQVIGLSVGMRHKLESEAKLNAAVTAANTQADLTIKYNQTKEQYADPSLKDFSQTWDKSFDEHTQSIIDGASNDIERSALTKQFVGLRAGFRVKSATDEAAATAKDRATRVDQSLGNLLNGVQSDPSSYEINKQLGAETIANMGLSPAVAAEATKGFGQHMARTRFDALKDRAQRPQEVESILKELNSEEWRNQIEPKQYERLQNELRTKVKEVQTKLVAEARGAMTALSAEMDNELPVSPERLAATHNLVMASGNPALAQEWVGKRASYEEKRYAATLSPKGLEERRRTIESGALVRGAPPEVMTAVNAAVSASGGSVTAPYMFQLARKESDFNPNAKAKTSSAEGLFGFIDQTWEDTLKAHGAKYGFGPDTPRTNAKANSLMAMELTRDNRAFLQGKLGRADISDGELYLAHFFGAKGAAQFLSADPSSPAAAAATPKQVAANPGVFKPGATVADVTAKLTSGFVGGAGYVAATRYGATVSVQSKMEAAMKSGDQMEWANKAGVVALAPISFTSTTQDFNARSQQAATVSSFYDVQSNPFTKAEAADLTRRLNERETSTDDKFELVRRLASGMGAFAPHAFDQLGEKDGALALIGSLAVQGGEQATVAKEVLTGRAVIQDSKNLSEVMFKDAHSNQVFFDHVGTSLDSANPSDRQAVKNAADAVYAARAGGDSRWDPQLYKRAVDAVTGGAGGKGGVGTVNGAKVVLPVGVSAVELDNALERVTPADLVRLSPSGSVPVHSTGKYATPEEISSEGRLRSVGAEQYAVFMSDNKPLRTTEGRLYLMQINERRVTDLLQRPARPSASFSFDASPGGDFWGAP